jgi:hypothetical protein
VTVDVVDKPGEFHLDLICSNPKLLTKILIGNRKKTNKTNKYIVQTWLSEDVFRKWISTNASGRIRWSKLHQFPFRPLLAGKSVPLQSKALKEQQCFSL